MCYDTQNDFDDKKAQVIGKLLIDAGLTLSHTMSTWNAYNQSRHQFFLHYQNNKKIQHSEKNKNTRRAYKEFAMVKKHVSNRFGGREAYEKMNKVKTLSLSKDKLYKKYREAWKLIFKRTLPYSDVPYSGVVVIPKTKHTKKITLHHVRFAKYMKIENFPKSSMSTFAELSKENRFFDTQGHKKSLNRPHTEVKTNSSVLNLQEFNINMNSWQDYYGKILRDLTQSHLTTKYSVAYYEDTMDQLFKLNNNMFAYHSYKSHGGSKCFEIIQEIDSLVQKLSENKIINDSTESAKIIKKIAEALQTTHAVDDESTDESNCIMM